MSSKTWLRYVSEWKTSNLSQAEFCRQKNLHPGSLSYWKRQVDKKENPATINPLVFSSISLVPTEVSQKIIELNLPYGMVLKIPVK